MGWKQLFKKGIIDLLIFLFCNSQLAVFGAYEEGNAFLSFSLLFRRSIGHSRFNVCLGKRKMLKRVSRKL